MSKILIDEATVKLVLEALELNNNEWKSLADSGDSGYWKAEEQVHYQLANEAIAALKALAEQPARPYRLLQDNGSKYFGDSWDKAEQPAQQALDKMAENARELGIQMQPAQQEPVAWMDGYRNIYSLEEKAAGCPEATIALVPMANHKKTSGSPIKELNCICGAVWEGDELVHLPRPPAQRTWVGLTDDDIDGIYQGAGKNDLKRAREVIAAFKERNT